MPTPPQATSNDPTSVLRTNVGTIAVGTITADSSDAEMKDSQNSVWQDYEIHNRYESDKHRYMTGITSPDGFQGNSVAFVQLASPTLLWIADWTASRSNQKPTIPDPDVGEDWILLDEHMEPGMVIVGPDGETATYRISGTYFYGMKSPNVVVVKDVNFSRAAWLANTFDREVPDSLFETGLITLE